MSFYYCECGQKFRSYTPFIRHLETPHNDDAGRAVGDIRSYTAYGQQPVPRQAERFASACYINSLDTGTLARFLAGDGFKLISTYTVTAGTFDITMTRTSDGGLTWEVREK